jgi:Domain of unknown function (DUF4214)
MATILRGTAARDTIGGSSADGDTVIGAQGNDYLLSGPGADVFAFNPGDGQDWIDGFTIGVDKLQFGGGLTAANLSYMNLSIEDVPGLAVIYGGEPNFVFLARATAASLSPADVIFGPLPTGFRDAFEAQITRLYDTVFDRPPDTAGLEFWHKAMRDGLPLQAVADRFVAAPEFQTRYGTPDNLGFVQQLYRNVLDREGEPSGIDYWTDSLNSGRASRTEVVIGFSEAAEHQAKVLPGALLVDAALI